MRNEFQNKQTLEGANFHLRLEKANIEIELEEGASTSAFADIIHICLREYHYRMLSQPLIPCNSPPCAATEKLKSVQKQNAEHRRKLAVLESLEQKVDAQAKQRSEALLQMHDM